jgi:hypothetical protein
MLVVFEAMSRRAGAVVNDDVLYRFRLRLFSLAGELGKRPGSLSADGRAPLHLGLVTDVDGLQTIQELTVGGSTSPRWECPALIARPNAPRRSGPDAYSNASRAS